MASTVEELLIKIDGDMGGLRAEMEATRRLVDKGVKGASMSIEKMGDNFIKGTAKAAKWGVAVAAAAVAGGVAMARAGLIAASNLQDTADKLDLVASKLQAMRAAAELNGAKAEDMDKAIREYNKSLADALNGSAAARAEFAKLGLSYEELAKGDTAEGFLKTANAVGEVGSQALKTDAAFKMFGKSGNVLLNQLRDLQTETARQEERMDKLGISMSSLDLSKAQAGADALDKLGSLVEGALMKLGAATGTVFQAIEEELENTIIKMGGVGAASDMVREIILSAVKYAVDAWQGFGIILNVTEQIFFSLKVSYLETMRAISVSTQWITQKVMQYWTGIKSGFEMTINGLVVAWYWWRDVGYQVAAAVVGTIGKAIASIGQATIGLRSIAGGPDFQAIGGSMMEAGVSLNGAADKMKGEGLKGLADASANMAKSTADYKKAVADFYTTAAIVDTADVDAKIEEAKADLHDLRADLQNTLNDIDENGSAGTQARGRVEDILAGLDAEAAAKAKARDDELAADGAHYDAKAAAAAEFQARVAAIKGEMAASDEELLAKNTAAWEYSWRTRAELVSGILGNLASLQQTKSKQMFEVGKMAGIAQAIVDTYAGATKALATVPYPLNFAAAAAVVASGFANVQKIRATQFGSTTSGGGGSGAPSVRTEASDGSSKSGGGSGGGGAQSTVNITLLGDSYSPKQVRGLISAINKQVGDNAKLKVSGD